MKGEPGRGQGVVEKLLVDLEVLDRRYLRGDVTAKVYAKQHAELMEQLGRGKVRPWLERGEEILGEHQVVAGHFRFTQSLMKETALEAVAYYVTDRRLLRWVYQDKPSPKAALLPDLEERVEDRWYSQVERLEWRREYRWSEALTGVVILGLALLLWPLLQLTGPLLVLLGALGVLHVLVMPTRWVAVVGGGDEWRIDAPRKPSGRHLLALLEGYLTPEPHVAGIMGREGVARG